MVKNSLIFTTKNNQLAIFGKSLDEITNKLIDFHEITMSGGADGRKAKRTQLISEEFLQKELSFDDAKTQLEEFNKHVTQGGMKLDDYFSTYQKGNTLLRNYVTTTEAQQQSTQGLINASRIAREEQLAHNEAIKQSTLAYKAASLAKRAFAMVANIAISTLVIKGIEYISKQIDELANSAEHCKERVDSLMSTFEDELSTANSNLKTVEQLADRYTELSKGVNNLGENVGLTTDEYSEYNDIVNQIADMSPELVAGWTDEGNAILKIRDNVEELIQTYKNAEIAAYNMLIAEDSGDIMENWSNLHTTDFFSQLFDFGADDVGKGISLADALTQLESLQNISAERYREIKGITGYGSHNEIASLSDIEKNIGYSSFLSKALGLNGNISDEDYESAQKMARTLIQTYRAELNLGLSNVRSLANAYLNISEDYASLDAKTRTIASLLVNSLDENIANSFANGLDIGNWVNSIIDALGDNDEIGASLEELINFDSANTKMTPSEAKAFIDKQLQEIVALLNEAGLDENVVDLKVRLGLDIVDEAYQKYVDVKNYLNNNGLADIRWDGFISQNSINTVEELDKLLELAKQYSSVATVWQEYLNWLASKNVEDAVPNLSLILTQNKETLDANKEQMEKLLSALDEYYETGTFSEETQVSLIETFSRFQNGAEITEDSVLQLHGNILNMTLALFDGVEGVEAYTDALMKMYSVDYSSDLGLGMLRSISSISGFSENTDSSNYEEVLYSVNTLKAYTKNFSDFQKQIWLEATAGIEGYDAAIRAYESRISSNSFSDWLKNDDFTSYIEDMQSQIEDFETAAYDFTNADISELITKYNDFLIPFMDGGEITKQTLIDATAATERQLEATLRLAGATDQYTESVINQKERTQQIYSDSMDQISELTDAWNKLWEFELQVDQAGKGSYNVDDTEFTKFISDLITQFPYLAQYTDGTTASLQDLRNAIADLIGMNSSGTISYLEGLKDAPDITEEARHQIDLLIDSLNNLSNINISMDTTKDVIADMRQEMQNLAEFIYTINTSGLTLNVEDAQKYLDLYPELLQNAQLYADGTVKLNEGIVNEFIRGKEAEIQADGEARITELENERAILEVKRQYALLKMQTALNALQSESLADKQAAIQKLENLETEEEATVTAKQNELQANADYSSGAAENSDMLNTKVSQDASDMYTNADKYAKGIADTNATNFGNSQVSVNGLTESMNALSQAYANVKAGNGKVVNIPGLSVASGVNNGAIGTTKTMALDTQSFKQGDSISEFFGMNDQRLNQLKGTLEAEANKLITEKLVLQFNNAAAEYNAISNSLGEIDKQIAMIQANGGLSVKDYVGNLVNGLAQEAAEKAGGGKKGTGSGGTSGTKETFDWIETAIKRIEYGIESLDKIAGNTYNKFGTRNEALRNQLEQTRNEIDLQSQAYLRYMAEAESVGLSSYWKNKVQRGEVNIETLTNETLIEQINAYTEWYFKCPSIW